jgi:glycosyltransferase involved in cell wall biosynthesis
MPKVINLLFNDFTNDNRVLKESRSLQNNGFQVELLATQFDKTLPKEEDIDGIKVKRINVGHFKFLPINLILFWIKAISRYRKENIFHANDLYGLPPAYIIKKLFNKDAKIVYDCHEHETEAHIYSRKPILKFFAKIFEKMMIGSADEILVVSESIKEEYENMYDIKEPTLIMNCPHYKEYGEKDLLREELNIPEEKIIFLYQGKYQPGRGVEGLIDIFKKSIESNPDIVLVLLSYGKNIEQLKSMISDIDNIYWHDKVPPDIYMNYVASADWGVHFMENTCKNHDYAMPNKLFDYFMGGLPVIVSNLKEMSNFVKKHDVGYVIDLEQSNQAVDIIKNINKDSKKKFTDNVKKVSKEYTWEEQEKKLVKLYKSII